MSDEANCGIFPKAAVIFLSEQSSSATSEANELAAELTDVLKDWWTSIKVLFWNGNFY